MGFIDDADRIIIMDINRSTYDKADPDYSLKTDEMKRLRDVGIRTVLQQMWWGDIERNGRCYWEPVDVGIERAREAGLNVLLQCYQRAPADLPEDWYARKANGQTVPHLSIWNDDANEYEEAFVRKMARRYAGDDVLIMNSLISDGETMFILEPHWYDPAGMASYRATCGEGPVMPNRAISTGWLKDSMIRKMIQYQGLLREVNKHDEIWMSLHPLIEQECAGNRYWIDILRELRLTYPETAIFWLLYTFFELPPDWRQEKLIVSRQLNVNLVTGAQHCQGLSRNAPKAKAENHRLLCGPRHNNILPDIVKIEDWMYKALQEGVNRLAG